MARIVELHDTPIRSAPISVVSRQTAAAAPSARITCVSSAWSSESATITSVSPYACSICSSSSAYTARGAITVVRTMPSSTARLSSRDTRGWEMRSCCAICGCRIPRS